MELWNIPKIHIDSFYCWLKPFCAISQLVEDRQLSSSLSDCWSMTEKVVALKTSRLGSRLMHVSGRVRDCGKEGSLPSK